ncbi:hypothetical protein HQ487_03970, partial [Candidatus Uhrbacteria bacterium]|nr:hypothetical protein [Candidatus Uhrbacteria bacterium]
MSVILHLLLSQSNYHQSCSPSRLVLHHSYHLNQISLLESVHLLLLLILLLLLLLILIIQKV